MDEPQKCHAPRCQDDVVPDPSTARATPYLAVDVDVLDANIARMEDRATDRGLALRPHVKTHKSPEIARRQVAAGATGITVATLAEAEVFVEAGFPDVFIAYPLWVDAGRGARLRALAERADLRLGVDSAEGARMVARHAGHDTVDVLVEVDSGHHRTGVRPDEAGVVAEAATDAGLQVRGVFTFPGHSYAPGQVRGAAADEAAALRIAADSLRSAGLDPDVVSGGSTPSAASSDGTVLTEMRPGVYVFNDAQQVELGTCRPTDVALVAYATVVSRSGNRAVVDAGGKVLGADRAVWSTGCGRLPDHLDARVVALSEHHATIAFPDGEEPPPLGQVVRVMPNHVCAAVNLVDELVIVRQGNVIDSWPVAARGANS
jgi:D-serine deaminase-like pyridoxal phosphate-dependent protein